MKAQPIFTVSRCLGLFPFDNLGSFNYCSGIYSLCITVLVIMIHTWKFLVHLININGVPTSFLASAIDALVYTAQITGSIVHIDVMLRNKTKFTFLSDLNQHSTPSSDLYFFCYGILSLAASEFLLTINMEDLTIKFIVDMITDLTLIFPLVILLQYLSILIKLRTNFSMIKSSTNVDRHEHLVLLSMHINSLYGRQMLVFLVGWLFNLIITAYELVYSFYDRPNNPNIDGYLYLSNILFIVFYMSELLYLCGTCSSTVSEAEAFNHELFRMMRANDRLCNNKKLHLYVTMKQTVEFTACGFFKLGYPLVTSIIAAATTYLVILIQFSFPKTS